MQKFRKIVFGRYSASLQEFEAFVRRAKQSGATHVVLTAEDIPWANWQFDTPGDPYPAWANSNHGLLKVAVPDALASYVPKEYSERTLGILRDRCQVLAREGLRGVYTTFEPQMLPESVFEDHPKWRGPQVDSPIRSRVPRFAPSIDEPEVLALYRESLRKLVTACPQLDTISLHTNDSGSGMSWSDGLYPGANGNTFSAGRRMYQRYHDVFAALRAGAMEGGAPGLEIDVRWDRERMPELIALKLEAGTAIANLEGPLATPYKAEVGFLLDYYYPYYPAAGIPLPVRFLEEMEEANQSKAPRLFVLLGDRFNTDLYFSLFDAFVARPTSGATARHALLRDVAAKTVGKEYAELLLEAWLGLSRLEQDAELLEQGGYLFYLGSVQQRWLTRPFVPFPAELSPEEKDYYRRFQFQATTESRAENLNDLQGTLDYDGMGALRLTRRIFSRMLGSTGDVRHRLGLLAEKVPAPTRNACQLLDARIRVFEALIRNCRNAIEYQYYLDIARTNSLARPLDLGGFASTPEWQMLRYTARHEIDNTNALIDLLESGRPDLIQVAPTAKEEGIRILEPNLTEHLRRKVRIMIRHWEDYERLFIRPDRGTAR
ncbi:MAG: hypothetical protein AB1898_00560 [Acidobacteriota bacterium]